MASTVLRSCGVAAVAPSLLSSSKSKFATSLPLPNAAAGSARVTMSADWMPGQPRPPYLDGSAPGDFGFDPLRLGEVPENLERYKESELIHCRWAMLAVPGVLVPEALGLGNWVQAQEWAAIPGGQATYLGNPVPWGNLPTILAIEFLAIAFVEHQRSMEKDTEKKKYPGGAFDPLGYSKDPVKPPCNFGVRRVLRPTVGLSRNRTIGESGFSLGRPMAQQHWRCHHPQINYALSMEF
ncbi:Chlorophyll a-b binding protein 6A, chloroplastic [Vitis vinifera]|uniref:Chlorophyll a-b binding protein, chloroplastic n=1 Tax=Vitis vinifera TaxID=29760 RepID=A0A438D9K8_VITVI|nr:Chlorophyll a-b binding protein 6A, chloroplastic [Vitis vinifera]